MVGRWIQWAWSLVAIPDDDAIQVLSDWTRLGNVRKVWKSPLSNVVNSKQKSRDMHVTSCTSSLYPMCIPQSNMTFLSPIDTKMQLLPTSSGGRRSEATKEAWRAKLTLTCSCCGGRNGKLNGNTLDYKSNHS